MRRSPVSRAAAGAGLERGGSERVKKVYGWGFASKKARGPRRCRFINLARSQPPAHSAPGRDGWRDEARRFRGVPGAPAPCRNRAARESQCLRHRWRPAARIRQRERPPRRRRSTVHQVRSETALGKIQGYFEAGRISITCAAPAPAGRAENAAPPGALRPQRRAGRVSSTAFSERCGAPRREAEEGMAVAPRVDRITSSAHGIAALARPRPLRSTIRSHDPDGVAAPNSANRAPHDHTQ